MADDLKNVHVLDPGTKQLGVNQIGINLVHEATSEDPVVEVVVVARRESGLLEVEACLESADSLAKMAEHLTLRSNFQSATENAARQWGEDDD